MTKDYAKKGRPNGASKRQPPASSGSRVPGWVWLFTGTVLGAFITFLMYLSGLALQPGSADSEPAKSNTESSAKADIPKPRFDFYKMLKESEVPVTPSPESQQTRQELARSSKEYILQAGSFRKREDADRMRAELIMMNLDAYMETNTIRQGEVWHRVLTGPYDNRSKMAKARSILVSNDINPLLLTREKK